MADTDFNEILKLQEKLPQAICDELTALRPPSLGVREESVAPQLMIRLPIHEPTLIRFLLGDPASQITGVNLIRKQVSLEICKALVTPGKLKKLLNDHPEWFHSAELFQNKKNWPGVPANVAFIRLQDPDARFGWLDQKWRIPGWIESGEVQSARVGKREYRRLANAITNQMQFIELVHPEGWPLGFFEYSDDLQKDWPALKIEAQTPGNRQKQIDTYRLMMENAAYQVLNRKRSVDEIKKLHEFYKNLLAAYQIYPEESQFKRFSKGMVLSEQQLKKIIDLPFLKSLSASNVRPLASQLPALVFRLFWPDPVLQGMYVEFLGRLQGIAGRNQSIEIDSIR